MDPDDPVDDLGEDMVGRPLPPPPSVGELFDIFRQRFALRHPGVDPTRVVLVLATVIAMAGMAWALWRPRAPAPSAAPVSLATTSTTPMPTSTVPVDPAPTELFVDVAGAVVAPGPVEVAGDGRVEDAIRAAGGPRDDADLERVARAAPLIDGQRVYVPTRGQTDIPEVVGDRPPSVADAQDPAEGTPGDAATGPVDLNTADESELVTLPGVGPATAAAIIAHRSANGPFRAIDDLLDVKGIGPAKMETLRPHVSV